MLKVFYTVSYETGNEYEPYDLIVLEALFDDDTTTTEIRTELQDIINDNFYSARLINWEVEKI